MSRRSANGSVRTAPRSSPGRQRSTHRADDDSSALSVYSIAQNFGGQIPFIEFRKKFEGRLTEKELGDLDEKSSQQYLIHMMIQRQEELRREARIRKIKDKLDMATSDVATFNSERDSFNNDKLYSSRGGESPTSNKYSKRRSELRDRVDFFEKNNGTDDDQYQSTDDHERRSARERVDRDLGLDFVVASPERKAQDPDSDDEGRIRIRRKPDRKEIKPKMERNRNDLVSKRFQSLETTSKASNTQSKNSSHLAESSSTVVASYNRNSQNQIISNRNNPRGRLNDQHATYASNNRRMKINEEQLDDFSPQKRALHGLPVGKLSSYQDHVKTIDERAIEMIHQNRLRKSGNNNVRSKNSKTKRSVTSKQSRIRTSILEQDIIQPRRERKTLNRGESFGLWMHFT